MSWKAHRIRAAISPDDQVSPRWQQWSRYQGHHSAGTTRHCAVRPHTKQQERVRVVPAKAWRPHDTEVLNLAGRQRHQEGACPPDDLPKGYHTAARGQSMRSAAFSSRAAHGRSCGRTSSHVDEMALASGGDGSSRGFCDQICDRGHREGPDSAARMRRRDLALRAVAEVTSPAETPRAVRVPTHNPAIGTDSVPNCRSQARTEGRSAWPADRSAWTMSPPLISAMGAGRRAPRSTPAG